MSAIFYHDEKQKKLAESTRDIAQQTKKRQIVTKILPAERFYDAEGYHQKYLLRNKRLLFNSLSLDDDMLIKSHVAARLNGYVGGFGNMYSLNKEIDSWGLSNAQVNCIKDEVSRNGGSGIACGR